MKSIKLMLLAAFFYVFTLSSNAQVSLSIDSVPDPFVFLPSPLHLGTRDTMYINIRNKSNLPFSGKIYIYSRISNYFDTTGIISKDTVINGAIYYPTWDSIETLSSDTGSSPSVTRALVFTPGALPFVVGPNGVIIWPIYANQQQLPPWDSVGAIVSITYPAAINPLEDKSLKVFMSGNELLIHGDGEYLLKNVKLFDVTGVEIYEAPVTTDGMVNMSKYADGIYFAEVTFADNSRKVFKIFNGR